MSRIAFIIEGNPLIARGQFNASISRIKFINQLSNAFTIDVFCISSTSTILFRLFQGGKKKKKYESIEVDGINIKMLWKTWYLTDYLLFVKLHKKKYFARKEIDGFVDLFAGYDLISAHSDGPAQIAVRVHQKYRVPFCVTWHGSDIHTLPFTNASERIKIVDAIEQADYNFFVSKALLDCSNRLTLKGKKKVLYNGVDPEFTLYSDESKRALKHKYTNEECKIVGFVGNLFKIKNAALLPDIFQAISNRYHQKIQFWIIGDGNQRSIIEDKLSRMNIECKLWGNQQKAVMPDFMNCIDVLVLPSQNEGLPLVVLEALSCGAQVVASDVGGIAEVIGKDNVVDVKSNTFINNFANKVCCLLEENKPLPKIDSKFSWEETAKNESAVYEQVLSDYNHK